MEIYDISMTIKPGMKVYPKNPQPVVETKTTIEEHGFEASKITLGSHTGSHIDAPRHFKRGGASVKDVPLEKIIGPCKVLDFTDIGSGGEITAADLEGRGIEKGDRILLKTRNSYWKKNDFPEEFVSLSVSAAESFAKKQVSAVGIDELSVEALRPAGDYKVHDIMAEAEIINIEGLVLKDVPAGEYLLCCLPLKIDVEASPVRAILISGVDF